VNAITIYLTDEQLEDLRTLTHTYGHDQPALVAASILVRGDRRELREIEGRTWTAEGERATPPRVTAIRMRMRAPAQQPR
jgi:hypothetical protein